MKFDSNFMTFTLGFIFLQDSSLFPKDSFLSLDGEKLFLLGVSWLHVGEYTCRAENKEGLAFAMATVKLQSEYRVHTGLKST